MRPLFKTVSILLFTAPVMTLAAAGDGKDSDSARKPSQASECRRISDVIGAKVSMLPGAKAVHEAAKDEKAADRPVGKITDLLMDCCSGKTKWAVVAFDKTLGFGGKTVAVPCDQLIWDAPAETFNLDQTDDQLKALPTFNCDDAKKNGLDLSVASLATYWPEAATSKNHKDDDKSDESKKAPTLTVDGKQFECAKPHLVTAKDVLHTAIYANSEKFGVVADGLIDHSKHGVAFVIVSHGGTLGVGDQQYLIPYYALCMHTGDAGTQVYSVNHTTKELEAGVRYQKPKEGAVDAEAIRRADEMFAADAPQHKTAKQ